MVIRSTEKIRSDETSFYEVLEDPSSETAPQEEYPSSQAGSALHQVFNKDTLNTASADFLACAVETEVLTTPSFWNKLLSWWKKSEKTSTPQISPSSFAEKLEVDSLKPLSSVPTLEIPDHIPEDLQGVKLPLISKKGPTKSGLTPSEIGEGLVRMSQHSLDSILFIIFQAQLEWEKEHANTAEKTFSKYVDFQKLQERILQDIKDVLVKDEQTAKHFKTAQNITLGASLISGLIAAAAQYGFLKNHPLAVTVSSIITASFTGLTMAAKTYFQRRMNEHQAEHEGYEHRNQYYGSLITDARERLMTIAEADNAFKERWAQHLRRLSKMQKIAFKK